VLILSFILVIVGISLSYDSKQAARKNRYLQYHGRKETICPYCGTGWELKKDTEKYTCKECYQEFTIDQYGKSKKIRKN
jgi:protein-arginine kinase activator protein McsA